MTKLLSDNKGFGNRPFYKYLYFAKWAALGPLNMLKGPRLTYVEYFSRLAS